MGGAAFQGWTTEMPVYIATQHCSLLIKGVPLTVMNAPESHDTPCTLCSVE